jgi:hypothetical protein
MQHCSLERAVKHGPVAAVKALRVAQCTTVVTPLTVAIRAIFNGSILALRLCSIVSYNTQARLERLEHCCSSQDPLHCLQSAMQITLVVVLSLILTKLLLHQPLLVVLVVLLLAL